MKLGRDNEYNFGWVFLSAQMPQNVSNPLRSFNVSDHTTTTTGLFLLSDAARRHADFSYTWIFSLPTPAVTWKGDSLSGGVVVVGGGATSWALTHTTAKRGFPKRRTSGVAPPLFALVRVWTRSHTLENQTYTSTTEPPLNHGIQTPTTPLPTIGKRNIISEIIKCYMAVGL